MSHADDLLRAAEVVEYASVVQGRYAELPALAARLREAAEKCVMVPRPLLETLVENCWHMSTMLYPQEEQEWSVPQYLSEARSLLAAAPGGEDE